ncbi:MAG: shikimate dehydrogenase [Micrococcales bacterium]
MVKKFAVLGSPIEHSKSPVIHSAAYRVLGLDDWQYERFEVRKGGLRNFMESLDSEWAGFSLTMPLKEEAARFATSLDRAAEATGAVNTLHRTQDGWLGFNTDVFGIVQAIHEAGLQGVSEVLILGSGATATSATAAVKQLAPGANVRFYARNHRTRDELVAFAATLGLRAKSTNRLVRGLSRADLVISTLPGGAMDAEAERLGRSSRFKPNGALFDVAYQPWPSELAKVWLQSEHQIISGLEMLLWQAIAQLRIFNLGDPALQLPKEAAVLEAMRHAISS